MLDKYQEDFRETLVNSSLVDLENGDGWFTWNNRRGHEYLVASRIDHFPVTEIIIRGAEEIRANVISTAGFDHWPVCLSWEGAADRLPKPFRFEQFWLEHRDFKGMVEQWRQEMKDSGGTRMYNFQQNLKVLKAKIHTWNNNDFGNIFEDKKRIILELTAT